MDFLPKVTCRRCHREYSALRSRCPQCGTKKTRAGERTTTSNSSDAGENLKWQFIFGIIVVSAVILAVMLLILLSVGGEPEAESSPSPTFTEPVDTPTPTPTPSPTPDVDSITITYYGSRRDSFTIAVGDKIELSASVYPMTVTAEPVWSSEDSSIITVTQVDNTRTYVVEGISTGETNIVVTCGDVTQRCLVYVKAAW